jgi:hypothetical protein
MASFNDVTLPNAGGSADQVTDTSGAQNPPPAQIAPITVTGQSQPPVYNNADAAGSGVDWSKIISAGIPIASNYLTNSQQATDQTKQAALIGNLTDKYGALANPYGAYRDAAAQKLAALQADPSSIANTPGYKFSLQQGLGAVANRDNRSFGVGAGSTNPDLMGFAQGLASKTYNDTISQYSAQAGVGQGTGPAAAIYGQGIGGIAGSTAAANAAKGANTNLLGTGAASIISGLIKAGVPASIAQQIARSYGGGSSAGGGGSLPGGAGGGNIPQGTPDQNGNISNGDGTFNSPSGQIVDANGQPVDPFGGGGVNLTDPTTGYPTDITQPDTSGTDLSNLFGGSQDQFGGGLDNLFGP